MDKMSGEKRRSSLDSKDESEDSEAWIGPMPTEMHKPKQKKRKGNNFFFDCCILLCST